MINETRLLNNANINFESKNFDKALFLYSQLSSLHPDNKEYRTYALLCDLANEDEEKATSLYDYFAVVKEEVGIEKAATYVEDIIKAYDGDVDKMMKMLKDITSQTVESLDAIEYRDFKELVNSRGSFREAFEDIMFSTKVAIENKDDFFDFVNKLIDNDFNTTAYSYLDGFNQYFSFDKRQEELYKKLEDKKNIEHNNK